MQQYDFLVEKNFTESYLRYRDAPIAIREAKCLEQMYPDIFEDIKAGDKFAGRIKMSLIGFSPEPGGLGYYCNTPAIRRLLEENEYTEMCIRDRCPMPPEDQILLSGAFSGSRERLCRDLR